MVRIARYAVTWLLSLNQISEMLECEQSSYSFFVKDRYASLLVVGPRLGDPSGYALGSLTEYAEFSSFFIINEGFFIDIRMRPNRRRSYLLLEINDDYCLYSINIAVYLILDF